MKIDPQAPDIKAIAEGERYRWLVEAITDYAVFMLDSTGHVTSWNPGARRFKGYEADEIIGRHFSTFYTPEDKERGVPGHALRQAQEEGRFEAEGWRVRKDGTRFWAHVVIDPVRDPSGRLLGFAKITRDLNERRAAEAALKESEAQFRLLVQGVSDYAIYMLTPDGHVRSWNAGAERIKGYRPDEIIGEHFGQFYTPEDQAAHLPRRALAAAAAEGRYESEGWRVRKDGSRFWANAIIDAVRSDDGELVGFAKITRDITERRAAQEELGLAREALFQAQKMEALGQLTGGVAHDFNNLLMAVLGGLELIRKQVPAGSRIARLADNAIHGAQRGAILTRRMLAFARQQELKQQTVSATALIRGMGELIDQSLGPNIWVRMILPDDLPPIITDPNQLETALLNLAVNARDAMPGGGTISIAADVVTADEGVGEEGAGDGRSGPAGPLKYVRVRVTDTGVGMDAETLRRATDPFFTTKGVGKGTGLGLSMVRGLAEQSGGRLELHSVVGQGATAALWFPAAEGAVPEPRIMQPPALGVVAPKSILVVDDDELVLLNSTYMLEDLGHKVIPASSGAVAMAMLQGGGDVDLVITDQIMPRMTGLRLMEEIQQYRPGLPVVLATGFAEIPPDSPDVVRLDKPFTQADLVEALNRVFNPPA